MNVIRVNDRDFTIEVIIKRSNRNVYLRVKNGILVFTTPKKLTYDFIYDMIFKNYKSITKALDSKPPVKKDTIHYLGKEYKLEIVKSNLNRVNIVDDIFYIHTKVVDNDHIQKIVTSFYASFLMNFVENNRQNIKNKFNLSFEPKITVKNVKTYFGECFPKRGSIILASKLAKYDAYYILSVMYHEYAHFFYNNHGVMFYRLLENVFPNYKKVQSNLRKIKYNDAF